MKLVRDEAESPALRAYLRDRSDSRLVSSGLVVVEVLRAVAPEDRLAAEAVLAALGQVPVTRRILAEASRLPPIVLRALDAIHLATAADLRDELVALVAYDQRLLDAAHSLGLPVTSPG